MNELRDLYRRTVTLVGRVRIRATETVSDADLSRWRSRALTEVLISDLWQLWNELVRDLLIASCEGCRTRSGSVVPARGAVNTWQRISYEAREHAWAVRTRRVAVIDPVRVNSYRSQDPTWGDLDNIVDVIAGLSPNNAVDLRAAFGATSRGLKDLQTVRNACFHKNTETWKQVKAVETLHFTTSDTRDPSDLAWKSYIGKTTPSFYDWADAVTAVSAAASK